MYRDSAGLPTIGVGHLLTKDELSSGKIVIEGVGVDWHAGLTPVQVRALLEQDLAWAEEAVNRHVELGLTQAQFDALVSFTFNAGAHAFKTSTLLKKVNAGDFVAVPEQLRRWVYSANQVDPILVKRREGEISQWEATV